MPSVDHRLDGGDEAEVQDDRDRHEHRVKRLVLVAEPGGVRLAVSGISGLSTTAEIRMNVKSWAS
ncbi:hypothetical protein [Micromonospora sp. L32]|uniref:hypothetical protein n=1 Tax=Micromonospora sp. L32 TaxID=3452214 RepID=UPI003F8B2DA3